MSQFGQRLSLLGQGDLQWLEMDVGSNPDA
jgi:hypothetical protein